MAFDPFVAIRLTPHFARRTGWIDRVGAVFGVLGFRTRNPTPREFVMAVRDWQQDHPPLAVDGLLGPRTWAEFRPAVRAYTGGVAAGPLPRWVESPAGGSLTELNGAVLARTPVPAGPEDRTLGGVIEAWLAAGGRVEANPYLAVPVGPGFVAEAVRTTVTELPDAGLCGTLRVGQEWPGAAGGRRTVVALASGAVVFIADGGQAYRQTAEAWGLDYLTGLYAGTAHRLTPLDPALEAAHASTD